MNAPLRMGDSQRHIESVATRPVAPFEVCGYPYAALMRKPRINHQYKARQELFCQ